VEAAAQMTVVAHAIWLLGKICTSEQEIASYTTLFTGIEECRFHKPVLPGDTVMAEGTLLAWKLRRIKHKTTLRNQAGDLIMTCVLGGFGLKNS
jgi:acyl dehydratase